MIVVMPERLAALLEHRKRRRRIIAALKCEAPQFRAMVRSAASIPERENRPGWHPARLSNHCDIGFGSGPAKVNAARPHVNSRARMFSGGENGQLT